jgi:hypothetical protein
VLFHRDATAEWILANSIGIALATWPGNPVLEEQLWHDVSTMRTFLEPLRSQLGESEWTLLRCVQDGVVTYDHTHPQRTGAVRQTEPAFKTQRARASGSPTGCGPSDP